MKFDVEFTDTFGGEANYAWVRRATFDAPADASDRTLMRRARNALGVTDSGRWTTYGDTLEFRPYGSCTVMFVTPRDE